MRWVWRTILIVLLAAVIGGGYWVYRTVWGTPFSFDMLLNRQAVFALMERPEALTSIGIIDGTWIDFHSGKLDPYSLQARDELVARIKRYMAEVKSWDRAKLSPQEQLSYDIALWTYERQLGSERFPWIGEQGSLYPVNQAFGVQKELPNFLMSQHQITNAKLARHYVDRVKALGAVLDAINSDISRQAKLGVLAPDFIIDDSIEQMKTLIASKPADNPLVMTLRMKADALKDLGDDEKRQLVTDATAATKDIVYPAFRRLIAEEAILRSSATHDAGVWHIKNGDAYYADQLKFLTTTDMSPEEIHTYGLAEATRITAEMDKILKSVGMPDGTVGERMDKLAHDPRFAFQDTDADREQMLARYKTLLAHVRTLLPKYFAKIPGQPLDVRRVPVYAEKGSAGAYYERPSADGSRPGVFFANLRNVSETPSWAMPTIAYHEGIPGHHLQIATATTITNLPFIRRFGFLPAYGEGWALYAEYLAKDMGLYDGDPYGDLGRLQAELFRAVRLVVDTGMHAQHWSREQAIDYFRKTTGMAESDVTAETERYVTWPGQACAYKIGMKSILELREKAKAELRAKFDLREYHSLVLENGAMPLWLLQKSVDRWIAEKEGLAEKPG
ncbi:MAG: DUF885 domain-containing protein [Proteobacteria bacterium]|nr:DUF885 domain-containing protein [Pseudomonadota bacterium]